MTVTMAVSPINLLLFSSPAVGKMSATRFDDSLAQARTNLDPDEKAIFVYNGAPAHRNSVIPAPNTELKMLPPYSPYLCIAEQAIRRGTWGVLNTSTPQNKIEQTPRHRKKYCQHRDTAL